jgi:hypothetical protein
MGLRGLVTTIMTMVIIMVNARREMSTLYEHLPQHAGDALDVRRLQVWVHR